MTAVEPDPFESLDDDPQPGPWFTAGFEGECNECGDRIVEGDTIRADGEGGWECGDHRNMKPWLTDEPGFGYWEAGDYS